MINATARNRISTVGRTEVITFLIGTIIVAAPLRPSQSHAETGTGQFCWAFDRYTHTVYYGDIENREDRSASFAEMLEISGIVHFGALCPIQILSQHRLTKQRMLDAWRTAEFDVIDTTFLSDLDY